jgi:teichuronic acid biosynthesis glycosyltransferase TuaG
LISIITPAYNASEYIAETIESVLAQTYSDWEMWVVDDHSYDGTADIVENYSENDSRIHLIRMLKNVGPAEARNIALRKANGRYIAFLDSDDLWHPEKLEKQMNFMRSHCYAFVFTSYQRIKGKNGKSLNVIKVPESIDYQNYLKNTIIGTLTVVIDREKTGFFEMPDVRSSHDMALWCDILKRGFKAYGLQETLAYYRVVPGSNTAKKLRAARDVWRVYRRIEGIALIPSLYNFIFYAFNASRKRIY